MKNKAFSITKGIYVKIEYGGVKMIGYITLDTNDFFRAAAFYDELLAEFGTQSVMETPAFIAWGPNFNMTNLCIIKPFDGNPATVSNGGMIALNADSQEKVDKVYNKAIALGANG
ncbi:hypothetical protein [Xenorhabdus hominickii]|nr:hypothetical protein [Xenorhabdus hominickii]